MATKVKFKGCHSDNAIFYMRGKWGPFSYHDCLQLYFTRLYKNFPEDSYRIVKDPEKGGYMVRIVSHYRNRYYGNNKRR